MRLLPPFLLCLAAASARAEIAPGYLEGDFDGDGKVEVVSLYDNPNGFAADLVIMSGDGNTVYDPALVLARGDAIAAVGRTGELVTLERGASGSILLAYGPEGTRTTLTIAFQDNAFRVIGFSQTSQGDGTLCELNLLTGKGSLTRGSESSEFNGDDMKSLPIADWKEIDMTLPQGCM
jgi:hypothetical protein